MFCYSTCFKVGLFGAEISVGRWEHATSNLRSGRLKEERPSRGHGVAVPCHVTNATACLSHYGCACACGRLQVPSWYTLSEGCFSVGYFLETNSNLKNGVFWVVTPCGSCKTLTFPGTRRFITAFTIVLHWSLS
jgi:hypothetical protein